MTTASLTDRYVAATLRAVPEQQRPDIEQELRASIADALDDRLESGEPAAEAERSVLMELGDPARLAAAYADRPLQLIGARFYLDYTRLLTVLLAIVVPIVAVVILFVELFQQSTAGEVVTAVLGTAVSVAVHIAFWTTLVFAILERTSARRGPFVEWTPELLPDLRTTHMSFRELVASVVFSVALGIYLLLSPVLTGVYTADGDPIGVLHPDLYPFWIAYFLLVIALGIVFQFVRYYRRPDLGTATVNLVLNLAFAIPVIWLVLNGELLNPAFVEAIGWPEADDVPGVMSSLIAIGSVLAVAFDSFEGYRDALRAR